MGESDAAEDATWADLWSRPVARLWRQQCIAPVVIARYVRVLVRNPGSATLAQMEAALGLTPASLARPSVYFDDGAAVERPDDEVALLVAAAQARRNGR